MTWERARQPEQIEARRLSITRAAAELFEARGFEGASLSAIARAAGVSKAAVYRYFESKEAIFLELLLEDERDWAQGLEAALAPLAGRDDADGVCDVLVQSLLERPRLAALMARVTSVLEHNVSADGIREFKREVMAVSLRAVNALHAALPGLSVPDAQRFLTHFYIFAGGLQPHADPPEAVVEVMAEPEFAVFCIDYAPTLREHARLLLRGLLNAQ
jgi:AcrR family transcriptional regulator